MRRSVRPAKVASRHDTALHGGGATDAGIIAAAAAAVDLVTDGARIGIGSGRAASAFIHQLGARCRDGLHIVAVPTSRAAAAEARTVGVPLIALTDEPLDLTVDGADEVAPNLDLIKGWGGALVDERIVATASRQQIIVVGPEKLVDRLGQRGRIPVEVIPLAEAPVAAAIRAMHITPTRRGGDDAAQPFVTDNGNIILDCALPEPFSDGAAARHTHRALRDIVGVVDTGLFLGTATMVLVGHPDGHVDTMRRAQRMKELP
jgi:ribose 5-phosphate isomerase A